MKPFIARDTSKLPPSQWTFYVDGVFIGFFGCLSLLFGRGVGVGETGSSNGDVSILYTFVGIIGLLTGVMFLGVGRLARVSARANAELTQRLTEQDERIKALEAQVAALTPPSPKS